MDPITLAAKQFLAQLERFWSPQPSAPIPPGRYAVRLVAAPSERGDLRKALRWLEWSPENRRPLVLFEDAFEDEARWLRGLVAKTADDCEAVRKGLTEDGILVTPLPTRPADAAIDAVAAIRYLEAVAEHMGGGVLNGFFLALVPTRVTDPKVYRGIIAKIAAPSLSPALRLAVSDVPGADLGALVPGEARFEVDRAELLAFLKQIGPKLSQGPAAQRTLPIAQPNHTLEKQPHLDMLGSSGHPIRHLDIRR